MDRGILPLLFSKVRPSILLALRSQALEMDKHIIIHIYTRQIQKQVILFASGVIYFGIPRGFDAPLLVTTLTTYTPKRVSHKKVQGVKYKTNTTI